MKLSVVVPCYDEERNVVPLYTAVAREADVAADEWELVFVDDGSSDGTLAACRALAEKDPRVRYVSLSRNFGKESALIAGLSATTGDAVVLMDGDLQHPPELIGQLVELYRDGHDQVVTRRTRTGDPMMRKVTARGYYGIVNRLIDVRLGDGIGDFRLLSRRAVEAVLSLPEANRFSKGLFAWVGFDGPVIDFVDDRRATGSSTWSLRSLVDYGVEGVLAFNIKPLRLLVYTGLTVMALSSAYIAFVVFRTVVAGVDAPGYATLITAILGVGGLQLVGLGILGEYVGRIYLEAKRRPHFLVRETNIGTPPRTPR